MRLLWNHLMPGIFPVPTINFRQAVGLLILARLLFGRFGCHGGHRWFRGCHSEDAAPRGGRFWKRCCGSKGTPEA